MPKAIRRQPKATFRTASGRPLSPATRWKVDTMEMLGDEACCRGLARPGPCGVWTFFLSGVTSKKNVSFRKFRWTIALGAAEVPSRVRGGGAS
jgi:hypothetical protein